MTARRKTAMISLAYFVVLIYVVTTVCDREEEVPPPPKEHSHVLDSLAIKDLVVEELVGIQAQLSLILEGLDAQRGQIDKIEKRLPPCNNWVVNGGTKNGAYWTCRSEK